MRPAAPMNSPAVMGVVYRNVGSVTRTTTAVTVVMSATVRRKHAIQVPSFHVAMEVVSPNAGCAMVNRIAWMAPMSR